MFHKETIMTIRKLIDKVQKEKPNTFTDEHMLLFVNEIEADVAEELRREDFEEYTLDDMDEELMVGRPYDRLYVSYLKSQVDYANEEYPSYQLNAEQHMIDFKDFADWVVRTGQAFNWIPTKFRNIL